MDTTKPREWLQRPKVERTLRILQGLILSLALCAFLLYYLWAFFGACAPGPPQFLASDLTRANLSVAGSAKTIPIPLSDPEEVETLVAAYRSMEKWRHETSATPLPQDCSLELQLKGDRRLVVVAAATGFPYCMIQEFSGHDLKVTAHVDLNQMRGYLRSKAQ